MATEGLLRLRNGMKVVAKNEATMKKEKEEAKAKEKADSTNGV